ncbi:MAG TPA: hypothetical protein VGL47_07240 [Amycolatopsis sp.]|uniref:hypothetical protein n=1 Tax=Amycolatopsis sp. TaxID=37632 RepID=UPI002F3EA1B8
MTVDGGEQYFDLNIERVLEHWPVAFAIREVIANALDEHALTGTAEPVIAEDAAGAWHVADFGRGLRYTHLTQNENDEKRRSGAVIGQFGMGLKDALAVFDRHDVRVEIRSAHGDITTRQRAKETFSDVRTLHAVIRPPADPHRAGTDVVLHGVTADDVAAAQNFFLHYSGDHLLETTSVGQVLKRVSPAAPGRIYVKGLLVAEEPNFLFSYNITDINAPLRRALNRERSNVGRSAYTDRVKAILKQCRASGVVSPLADDLAEFATGQLHDELSWREIAVHACTVLASQEKVVFVTPAELQEGTPQLRYAEDDGYRLVTVPLDVSAKLAQQVDLSGRPLLNLSRYGEAWNDSFVFTLVSTADLTPPERSVYELTDAVLRLAEIDRRPGVVISETMRLDETGHSTVGLWEPAENRIVIHRGQLAGAAEYCATLLHELTHAMSGEPDNSLEFEAALTAMLGKVALRALPRG